MTSHSSSPPPPSLSLPKIGDLYSAKYFTEGPHSSFICLLRIYFSQPTTQSYGFEPENGDLFYYNVHDETDVHSAFMVVNLLRRKNLPLSRKNATDDFVVFTSFNGNFYFERLYDFYNAFERIEL